MILKITYDLSEFKRLTNATEEQMRECETQSKGTTCPMNDGYVIWLNPKKFTLTTLPHELIHVCALRIFGNRFGYFFSSLFDWFDLWFDPISRKHWKIGFEKLRKILDYYIFHVKWIPNIDCSTIQINPKEEERWVYEPNTHIILIPNIPETWVYPLRTREEVVEWMVVENLIHETMHKILHEFINYETECKWENIDKDQENYSYKISKIDC